MPVNKQVLSPDEVRAAAFGLMTPEQIEYFQRELEIDFADLRAGPRPLPRGHLLPARLPGHGDALHHRRHAEASTSSACRTIWRTWSCSSAG